MAELPRQRYQPQSEHPTISPCAKLIPTWIPRPSGRPPCQSEKAALDLPAAIPSKAQPTSVARPWSWDVSSLPSPWGAFHPFSNDWLSNPWHECSLKSGRLWPPKSRNTNRGCSGQFKVNPGGGRGTSRERDKGPTGQSESRRRRRRRGRGGEGGAGGAGVLNSKHNGMIR